MSFQEIWQSQRPSVDRAYPLAIAEPHKPLFYQSISHDSPKEAPRPKRLGPPVSHIHGSIQAVQPQHVVQDIVATWGQHIQVIANQIIWLPIEICAWLLTHQPGAWQQNTVDIGGVSTAIDSGTGLDTLSLPSTAAIGRTASGAVYLSTDGDLGEGEAVSLMSDSTGIYVQE